MRLFALLTSKPPELPTDDTLNSDLEAMRTDKTHDFPTRPLAMSTDTVEHDHNVKMITVHKQLESLTQTSSSEIATRHQQADLEESIIENAEIGDEEIANPAPHVKKESEKKRAQNATFNSWFNKQAEIITKESIQKVMRTEDDEVLSLKAIMARQESQPIIGSPRDYQMELFERAKNQNTIAVLDTGSGKTLIAVLLLRHVIDKELDDRGMGKPRRISFFLVDKVTLVFQQYAVLRANLDQNIERFCGAMGCDLWTKGTWDTHFANNMVIVCTADVLVQCLAHSFITIEQINLLIFDEAHHAKKGHAYARIIKDFYLAQMDFNKRPRIFGMTASPVDVNAREDLFEKARELETLLHSQIVTTSNATLLGKTINRPEPLFVLYNQLMTPFETQLYQSLWEQYGDVHDFRRLFEQAKEFSSDLGRWCSEFYWTLAFSDREAKKYERKAQRRAWKIDKQISTDRIEAEISRLREAQNTIKGHAFDVPKLDHEDMSSKCLKLFETLRMIFMTPSEAKCLVFVQKRLTAILLQALFDRMGEHLPHLRTGALIGVGSAQSESLQTSFKSQVVTLLKFRKGDLNCLFATTVAEEGLDIPDCGYVIRFDPCQTMIQYIQSRGRARQKNSKFFHLVESGNMMERARLDSLRQAEDMMRNFCQLLPQDRQLHGNDFDIEHSLARDRHIRVYTVESTGAKLTYDFSLIVLAHFVTCLPHDEGDDLSINYIMSVKAGKFICEVILPPQSPIRSVVGKVYAKKSMAKRSAAFEACVALKRRKYLDDHLLPIYAKQLPAMRNAMLALSLKSSSEYSMQVKPTLWANSRGNVPGVLYLTVIFLAEPWDRPVSPIGLLTRTKLPALPDFPLYRITGQKVDTHVISLSRSLSVDDQNLAKLSGFTLAILQDVFNKTYERNEAKMSYWLAPLVALPAKQELEQTHPELLLDWQTASAVDSHPPEQWNSGMPEKALIDRFLIDPWDGGRRLFTYGIARDLRPSDPVPPGMAPGYRMDSIIEYSVKMFKKSRTRRQWDENQPVLKAEKALHRLNVLAEPSETEKGTISQCFVCPEPLNISQIPTGIAAMALLFPAILHRIESYLIALEFCDEVDLDIRPEFALEAITKDSDNTDDTQGEKINFQHGMGPNYERLEFIGDTFLKMATSIALFVRYANNNEEQMHIARMLMICNKNLFDNATHHEWFRFIRGRSFSRRTWYPEGLRLLQGKGASEQDQQHRIRQSLGAKTVADMCEAMIGAAFVSHFQPSSGDLTQMDQAVKAVSKFVQNNNHAAHVWADYYRAYHLPAYQVAASSASERDLVEKVQLEHNYRFKYPKLLRSAFSHSSQPRMFETTPSYERLEFLGDSLLDMVSVAYLFNRYTSRDPQWLTEHKMAMVSNKFFGAVCVKLGFHRHLRYCSSTLEYQIRRFVEEIEEAEEQAKGARDYWINVKDPPKCLPDLVESYVGAMLVDSAFDFTEVERFFEEHLRWYFEDMSIYDTFSNKHPVTRLHKLLAETMGCRSYGLKSQEVPSDGCTAAVCVSGLVIHGAVVAGGRASSSQYAKIKASLNALEKLRGLAPSEFRRDFRCDCREEEGEKEGEAKQSMEEVIGTAI